ncbi:Tyrosine recombinase XerD [Koleobacter methoxysyntrophicus]|uniref:Tyrosine recombinase XerD n=1 Tax=Koleobacter methoxysyntrophicus TaxID=2751313 RepID=A0A8A0RLE9_9FIRM|nr:tyrosine-type recombinase/integrase [Koleobacter methoxysyntrophicus]QSQ08438.1 Tyrosine recombinase XerD [Koleobacter methoxysyntrophicus]
MTTWHCPVWKNRDGSQTIFKTKERLICRYCGRLTRYLLVFSSGDSIPLCGDYLYAHIVNNKRALRLARKGMKTMKEKNSKKKGNKYREVPLNLTARRALKGWIEIRGNGHGPLFPGRGSRHITARSIEYMISRCAYDARLENVTPHVLRHTFCKSLVDAGESLDMVAVLAGHADLNTTAKYTRPTRKDLQNSVDKLTWE